MLKSKEMIFMNNKYCLLYTSVDSWMNKGSYSIDSPEKREALRNMFAKSQVALIYGSAGTGQL